MDSKGGDGEEVTKLTKYIGLKCSFTLDYGCIVGRSVFEFTMA